MHKPKLHPTKRTTYTIHKPTLKSDLCSLCACSDTITEHGAATKSDYVHAKEPPTTTSAP